MRSSTLIAAATVAAGVDAQFSAEDRVTYTIVINGTISRVITGENTNLLQAASTVAATTNAVERPLTAHVEESDPGGLIVPRAAQMTSAASSSTWPPEIPGLRTFSFTEGGWHRVVGDTEQASAPTTSEECQEVQETQQAAAPSTFGEHQKDQDSQLISAPTTSGQHRVVKGTQQTSAPTATETWTTFISTYTSVWAPGGSIRSFSGTITGTTTFAAPIGDYVLTAVTSTSMSLGPRPPDVTKSPTYPIIVVSTITSPLPKAGWETASSPGSTPTSGAGRALQAPGFYSTLMMLFRAVF